MSFTLRQSLSLFPFGEEGWEKGNREKVGVHNFLLFAHSSVVFPATMGCGILGPQPGIEPGLWH